MDDMISGTTKSGFAYSIPKDAIDNMELIDALAESNDDNPLAISKVCLLLMGKDTRKSLYDHLRLPDGRVPANAVAEEIMEIFGTFGQKGKNS